MGWSDCLAGLLLLSSVLLPRGLGSSCCGISSWAGLGLGPLSTYTASVIFC